MQKEYLIFNFVFNFNNFLILQQNNVYINNYLKKYNLN